MWSATTILDRSRLLTVLHVLLCVSLANGMVPHVGEMNETKGHLRRVAANTGRNLHKIASVSTKPFVVTGAITQWRAMNWASPEQLLQRIDPEEIISTEVSRHGAHKEVIRLQAHDLASRLRSKHKHVSYRASSGTLLLNAANLRQDIGDCPVCDSAQEDGFHEITPSSLRPPEATLVLGSIGASSSLQVNDFNATGWHVLVSGQQSWVFLPPWTPPHGLKPYRIPSRGNISARWVSRVDAFHGQKEVRSGDRVNRTWYGDTTEVVASYAIHAVQNAGEVIVIPSGWWHQVYHTTSTVGITGHLWHKKVLQHIMQWTGMDATCLGDVLDTATMRVQIKRVVGCAVAVHKARNKLREVTVLASKSKPSRNTTSPGIMQRYEL